MIFSTGRCGRWSTFKRQNVAFIAKLPDSKNLKRALPDTGRLCYATTFARVSADL